MLISMPDYIYIYMYHSFNTHLLNRIILLFCFAIVIWLEMKM
jgi:hypothetical protein